ncbi:MAG: hypothetical protein RLZZ387_444 [Chloroflexota bacterium]
MTNLLAAVITVTGVRPLLFHHFSPSSIPLVKEERSGVAGNDPDEWRKTVLVTETGQLYLEPSYAFGALRDAAKLTPRKRGTLQPLLTSTLQVPGDRLLVDRFLPDPIDTDPSNPVYIDVRTVKNPATRGRNIRYRVATSAGWRVTFTAEWDKTVVSRSEFLAVLLDAGRFCGFGDGRNIGFGRFSVDIERDVVITELTPDLLGH